MIDLSFERCALKRVVVLTVLIVVVTSPAWGFHELDCGPIRTEVIDEVTGKTRCLDAGPDTQRQFLRFQLPKKNQEKRTRDLQLEQRQRAKLQALRQQQQEREQANIT